MAIHKANYPIFLIFFVKIITSMLRILLSNKPITAFMLPLLVILIWSYGSIVHEACDTNFFTLKINSLLSKIIGGGVVLLTAFVINSSVNRQEIFDKTTYLPGALYILAVGYSPNFHCLSVIHIANIFLALSIRELLNIYRQVGCRQQIFNGSFFLLASSLFYPPYAIYLLLPWVALTIFRPFNLKEYLMPFLSLLIYFIWFTGITFNPYSLTEHFIHFFNAEPNEVQTLTFSTNQINDNLHTYLTYAKIGMFALLLNFGVLSLLKLSQKNSLRIKKISTLITVFLLFSGLLFILEKYLINNEHFEQSVSIAFSLLVGFFFHYGKRLWLKALIFYLLISLILINIYLS